MSVQYIEARHSIIAWRNRWLKKVDESFVERGVRNAKDFVKGDVKYIKVRLALAIDKISWVDKVFTDDFINVKLRSVLLGWSDCKENDLVFYAGKDLPDEFRRTIKFKASREAFNDGGFLEHANIFSVKLNTKEKLREGVALKFDKYILFNKEGTALRQLLKKAIEQTAEDILKELKYKEVNHAT